MAKRIDECLEFNRSSEAVSAAGGRHVVQDGEWHFEARVHARLAPSAPNYVLRDRATSFLRCFSNDRSSSVQCPMAP